MQPEPAARALIEIDDVQHKDARQDEPHDRRQKARQVEDGQAIFQVADEQSDTRKKERHDEEEEG